MAGDLRRSLKERVNVNIQEKSSKYLSPGTSLNLPDGPPKQQTHCKPREIFELSSSSQEESCDNISVSCHPASSVEMRVKLSLLIFLLLLLVYHVYSLIKIKTGSFEAETCDIDNHSNYFIFDSQWSPNKPRHNDQHNLT